MKSIAVPVITQRPSFRLTDSGDDLHIRLDRLGTSIGEMLVAVHFLKEKGDQLRPIHPDLLGWGRDVSSSDDKNVRTPSVTIDNQALLKLDRDPAHALFFTAVTQLVSHYEMYLGSIAKEIYRHNSELLAVDGKQLTSKEVVELGSFDNVVNALIRRATSNLITLAYPDLVARFNRQFHVGIHHDTSPISLFEVHHLIEQRNIIVHNDGFASEFYVERLCGYKNETVLDRYRRVSVDFERFFDSLFLIASLGDYIDGKVKERWKTSTD